MRIILILMIMLNNACAFDLEQEYKKCHKMTREERINKTKERAEYCQDVEMQKYIGKYWREMKQFFYDLKEMVRNDDKEKLAEIMVYPLNVYYVEEGTDPDEHPRPSKKKIFYTKTEFKENYEWIFHQRMKEVTNNFNYVDLLIQKNLVILVGVFNRITYSKNCNPKEISFEECKVIKIDYIDNDTVPASYLEGVE